MKCLTDSSPVNGNFIGTCTYLYGDSNFCSGVYNVDQFYDINTNTQVATGPCAGSIALVDPAVVLTPSVNDQPVNGGTGAYRGATGNAIITTINDPIKCPVGGPNYCYKIDFNLD